MTTPDFEPRLVSGTRDGRYGEVLLATIEGTETRVEVYNSYLLNDCPQDLWDALDPVAIAHHYGATAAILNGPRYWLMDGIGKVDNVDPVVRDFGGIAMRRAATIAVDGLPNRGTYKEISVNRGAIWFFDAGQVVHELTTSDGRQFVMQAYCTGVDSSLTAASLTGLGDVLQLPEGWRYESRTLENEMKIDTTGSVATVLQDELENTYTLVR